MSISTRSTSTRTTRDSMAQGVPAGIRTRALRKLWAANTAFTKPDGLQDYMGSYTDAAVASPDALLQSAYGIGRAFMNDAEVVAWAKLGKRENDEEVLEPARARAELSSQPEASSGEKKTPQPDPERHSKTGKACA